MRFSCTYVFVGVSVLVGLAGCHSSVNRRAVRPSGTSPQTAYEIEPVTFEEEVSQGAADIDQLELLPRPASDQEQSGTPEEVTVQPQASLTMDEVVTSIRRHFPLIRQAEAARRVASGQALSASGAFDHKLEGYAESQALDFYENHNQLIGIKRDTMWGGQTIAGYRIGRGFFEPWYRERETNKGGEFKAGIVAPLVRDRWIDDNRSELWQAQLEQRRVEPEIMAQVIRFVRDGSTTYWEWVAAGEYYRIAEGLLELARVRNKGLEEQVQAQEKAEIDLVDNRRIIVSREAKLIDARRKLEQAAVKLSLFYRSGAGEPVLADAARLPDGFRQVVPQDEESSELGLEADDIRVALEQRPELAELQVVRQQLCIALRQAKNETWPDIDGGLLVSQDVGEPTSPKRDKSRLQLDALLTVAVPIERRKALGKVRGLQGKLTQVAAKRQFAADKIVAELRLARTAIVAARERVSKATESYELAGRMQEAEQERFDQGQSTLFNLNIREQQTAESAAGRVDALLEYFIAKADHVAAMGHVTPAM